MICKLRYEMIRTGYQRGRLLSQLSFKNNVHEPSVGKKLSTAGYVLEAVPWGNIRGSRAKELLIILIITKET